LVSAKKSGRTKELKLSDDFYEYFHLQGKELQKTENMSETNNINKVDDEGVDEKSEESVEISEYIEKREREVVGENKEQ